MAVISGSSHSIQGIPCAAYSKYNQHMLLFEKHFHLNLFDLTRAQSRSAVKLDKEKCAVLN